MIDLGSLAEMLGLRRKKTVVERIQDAAEDVVETVVDTVMERVRPSKASPMTRVARVGNVMRHVELPELHMPEVRLPDVQMPDVRLPELHAAETLEHAADRVKHGAAATGTAAVGVAAGIGGFFGAILSGLWSLTTFLVKAAVLAGVAYAGWQYLQSKKTQQSWSGSPGATSSPSYPSSMYGSVNSTSSPEPARTGS